jgi:hypothetical protein
MNRLPPETQTLYAELSERLHISEATRTFSSLSGSFTKKSVKNKDYWYFKTSDGPAGQREYFVGADGPSTRAIIRGYASARPDVEAATSDLDRICSMLRHGGAMLTDAPSAKVISGLANAGIFKQGAVLVGTHAFIALGNVLGVRWDSSMRTQDIDLAAPRVLHIVVPPLDSDLPKALDSLNMGFLPVPGLDHREPATSFMVRGQSLRVDLLTPAHGVRDEKPVRIGRFNAAAQPLEFLDYLLDVPVSTAVINGGATLVNVPDPARFALHKLIISGKRQGFQQVKSTKDRQQAAEIIEILAEDRPGDLALAIQGLNKRAPAWRKRLKRELEKLPPALDSVRKSMVSQLDD